MGKNSTLIYLYDNFDGFDAVYDVDQLNDLELKGLFKLVKENTKKVPDEIVQNLIEFAKDYS